MVKTEENSREMGGEDRDMVLMGVTEALGLRLGDSVRHTPS